MFRKGSLWAALGLFACVAGAAEPKADYTKPYSTVTEAMKLVADSKAPGGRYLFDAALCAAATGDRARCHELLVCFLAKEKGATPEVRRALVRLCRGGAAPEYYARYLRQFPHDDDAFALGLDLATRQANAVNVAAFEETVGLLLDAWPKGRPCVDVMHFLIWSLSGSNIPDFQSGVPALRALQRSDKWELSPAFANLVTQARWRKAMIPEFKVLHQRRPNLAWPNEMLGYVDPKLPKNKVNYWDGDQAYRTLNQGLSKGGKGFENAKACFASAAAVFAKYPYERFADRNQVYYGTCQALLQKLEKDPGAFAAFPTAQVFDLLFGNRSTVWEVWRVRNQAAATFHKIGRLADFVAAAQRAIDVYKSSPGCRSTCRCALTQNLDDRALGGKARPLLAACTLDFVRASAQAPVPELTRLALRTVVDDKDQAEYRRQALPLIANGCSFDGDRPEWISGLVFGPAELQDRDGVAPEVRAWAVARLRGGHWSLAHKLARQCFDAGHYELAYLIANSHPQGSTESAFALLKAEASAKMPGLYPVGPNDPAYPVYVAADAFAAGNVERAWTLLNANRAAFDRDPLRFRPDFAVWALEQYRRVKGRDEELVAKASEHLERMLAKETSLPKEVIAGLYLLRAEIARDRLQTDVAHAAFLAVRNDTRFRGLEAARSAMFQDVALQLETGNLDAAAETAESWAAAPESDVRAQGHYVLAKVAFLRKDYEETRKELERCFEIDFTHAEARLLQGEWKLATNYEVDDTQVLLGDLADRRAIRPGQPLTVTVQDRNLSVAGGGQSIPVLVRTTAGGDEEKVLLYTGTRDPSLFRGSVDTVPGEAKKGNGRLELAGDDTVTYEIEPSFLEARGLAKSEVKRLSVVDDANLTVNGGEARATLRPGVPLRLVLRDADRSVHGKRSTVEVAVSTTSGDRLQAKLAETGVATGVFEAEVPTSLPPPRAFASDTLAGGTAADLASSVRHAPWQSRADGVRPKSVGVDMMDSCLVSSARVKTKDAAGVTRVRLYGTLYGDEWELGSYPAEPEGSRKGIRLIRRTARVRNRTDFLRDLVRKPAAAEPVADWEVRNAGGRDCRSILRASVFVPETQRLRFRLESLAKPPKAGDRDWRMGWALVELRWDGVILTSVRGAAALQGARECVLDAGVHELEIYAETQGPQDDFALRVENEDGSLSPLPKDWTDPAAHPELTERLRDVCAVTREADGFTAKFAKATRLRKLRWEFADFSGNALSAEKLVVVDQGGRTVIPAAKDYTGALNDGTLDLAPGDVVTIAYEDSVTLSGRPREIEERLDAKFANGTIAFLHESVVDEGLRRTVRTCPAYRVAPGDTILVCVTDPDLDVSEGADSVKVVLRTDSRKELEVTATEREQQDSAGNRYVPWQDAGKFYAQVPTQKPGDGAAPAGVLALPPGDGVTAIYVDAENTDPGVKAERKVRLLPVPAVKPEIKLASVAAERRADRSPEGHGRLATIRRRAESANATNVWKVVFTGAFPVKADVARVTTETPVPVELWAPGLVRHADSVATVLVATKREILAAKAEGRDPNWAERTLKTTSRRWEAAVKGARVDGQPRDALPDTLYGSVELKGARAEERAAAMLMDGEEEPPEPVDLLADDELVVALPGENGQFAATAKARVATTGWIALADATLAAENPDVHLGECFHVVVTDADRDVSDELDEVEVEVVAKSGAKRTVKLRETLPRSGVFSANIRPVIRLAATNELAETDFPSAYSDTFTFTYEDTQAGPGATPGTRTATGRVLPGSTGAVRSYSKRFRDADQAVLVQFRLAECLFERAKDYRKAKLGEKSASAIADGRRILEQALKDYPNTSHAAEGEYLLANLYEQLAEEERQARLAREKNGEDLSQEADKSIPLYNEAIARFASILSAWPDGEQAARCQYHKALCFERLGDFARASEEYVKMTYLFPESSLVGDASVRLAAYYYREKRYDVAGKIYDSFQTRFPTHPQAANALFMGGQCQVRRAEALVAEAEAESKQPPAELVKEAYLSAVESFSSLLETYKDSAPKDLLAQALYWAGDASFKAKDYANAYLYLKRTTFEYPESKWARHARGLLLQEAEAFDEVSGK